MSEARWIFFAALSTSFIGPFMGSAVNLAVPAIGGEFGAPVGSLGWIVTAYLLGSAVVLLPVGRLADIVGRKKVYTYGVALFLLGNLAATLAASMEAFIVCRLFQGVATAMIFGTGMAMIVSVHAPKERGKVIGYSAAATYIGLSVGPMLGGFITEAVGWRGIFYLTGLGLVFSLFAVSRVRQEWYGARGEAFDWRGALLYIGASGLLLYGCSTFAQSAAAKLLLAVGGALLVWFVRSQTRCAAPLVDMRLLRENTVFAMSSLAAMINYSATFAIGFVLSLYLQLIRGMDASAAGLILLVQPALMAVFSPAAGALSDRLEPRVVASVGMALNAAGLFFFAFLQADTPIWLVGVNVALIGLGFALFSSPNNNAIMGAVEAKYYGIAASILSAMRLIGQALSMAVVTAVIAHYGTSAGQMLAGFDAAFGIFAALCSGGIWASLARGKR